MLTELLPLILKGTITGIGSKGGQALVKKLKEYFAPSVAEKIGEAYYKVSISNEEEGTDLLRDDSYYEQLLYPFSLIDNSELPDYQKNLSKKFLREIFKDSALAFEVLSNKSDKILKNTQDTHRKLDDIESLLKTNYVKASSLANYSKNHFLVKRDYENYPEFYITRRIATNESLFSEKSISSFSDLLEYTKTLNNKPVRAVVIADGGIGKSIYSKYLAKDCSTYKDIYPVFISLRDLKPTDILQDYVIRRFPELSSIDNKDYNQLSFFLDGFDEIGDSSAAIKQVSDFSTTYSNSYIILTSRKNAFFGELPDFIHNSIYTLLDLNFGDINEYINKKYKESKIDTTLFFKEISSNGFINLVENPFYLDVLINCYIQNNNSLKISKKELIDNLITSRRKKDVEKRPDLQLDRPNIKFKVLQLGKQFAFTQALMDQRSLSEANIAYLFDDDFDLAINSLPIKKGQIVNNEQQWEFEHNIFLEHLVSDVLKELTLEQILEYTCSEKIIKSKWRDIISHLLGILDTTNPEEETTYKELINWLAEYDAEILLKLEESQLPKEFCSKIFCQMYQRYQARTIWIDTNRIDIESFASFGEDRENVTCLFNDITNENENYRCRINASMVFKYFSLTDFSEQERKSMKELYIKTLLNVSTSDHTEKETLAYYLISNFPFEIDQIVTLYNSTSNSQLMSAILHLINEQELQDKYIKTVINFHIKVRAHRVTGNYHINPAYSLTQLKESSSYVTFFNTLVDEEKYYDYSIYNKDEFKIVVKNSCKFSSTDLTRSVIMVSSQYASWSSSDEWNTFSIFFEDDNRRKISLQILLELIELKDTEKTSSWMFLTTLARIIKSTDLPFLFKNIDNLNIYMSILSELDKNSDVYSKVLEYLKEKYNYIPMVRTDPWIERRKDEFAILFEKENFQKECLVQFDRFGDVFNPHQIFREERKSGEYINGSIRAFMSWFVGDGDISITKLEKWFEANPDKFNDYLHRRICSHMPQWNSTSEMPSFTEKQMEVIKTYYNERILQVTFLVNVDRVNNTFAPISYQSYILIVYLQRFNYGCPDDKLCEMLGNYNADFNFIINKVSDKQKLIESILHNLDNYPLFLSSRLNNMIQYCVDNKIEESYSSILKIITDATFKDYDKVSTIKYCVKNKVLVEDIIRLSAHLTQYQELELCEELIKSEYSNHQIIKDKLYSSLESPEEEKNELFALSLLIWLKDNVALQLFINYCKRNSKITFNSPFDGVIIGREHLPDNYLQYDDIGMLPLLMELLELSMNPSIQTTRRGSKIESNLIHLALLSSDNYIEVTLTLEEFIKENKDKYEDVEFIYYTINKIEKAYNEKNSKRYSFKEAKEISQILLC